MRSCCTLNSGVDLGDVRINSIPSAWNVPNIKDKFLGQWSQRVPLFQPNKLPEVRGTLTHPIRNMARRAICDSGVHRSACVGAGNVLLAIFYSPTNSVEQADCLV